jgi:hypothetical protein
MGRQLAHQGAKTPRTSLAEQCLLPLYQQQTLTLVAVDHSDNRDKGQQYHYQAAADFDRPWVLEHPPHVDYSSVELDGACLATHGQLAIAL